MAVKKSHEQANNLQVGAEDALVHALFGDRHSAAFAYKKTQRLAAGIYLVTRGIAETDSIRAELRMRAITLLENMCALSRGGTNQTAEGLREDVSADILSISSLLEIARIAGIISNMNASILLREYAALDRLLQSREDDIAGAGAFASDLFDISDWSARVAGARHDETFEETDEAPEPLKDKKTFKKTPNFDKGQTSRSTTKGQKKEPKENDMATHTGNTRQDVICNVARKKGRINVKDVSSVIVDCSEKTLQRELATLVQKGILKKYGERRWSTYQLA